MTGVMDTSVAQKVKRSIKYAILGVFVAGVHRRSPGAIVNAVRMVTASYLPDTIERLYGVEFRGGNECTRRL